MAHAHDVASAGSLPEQSLHRAFYAVLGEVAQERIAGAQRKESKDGRFPALRFGVEPIYDFIGSAIASDCEEAAVAVSVVLARNTNGIAGARGFEDIEFEAASA
jgi:hypothetical protein